MDAIEEFYWVLSVLKVRVDIVSDSWKAVAIAWWASETRMSPNRKDVVNHRIGVGVYTKHAAQYLMESGMEFYLRFRTAKPEIIIGKRTFDSFRPFWIKKMKDRNVCCCIYHVEMDELRVGFNFMRKQSGIHTASACTCHCEEVCGDECGCHGRMLTFPGTTSMQESILCPIDNFTEWHDRKCIFGECDQCGIDNFGCCPVEEQGSSPCKVKWKRYAMQIIKTKKGEERKKLQLIYKETRSNELIAYLKPKLAFFVQHSFVARWEDAQFKKCLENIPDDAMVSVVDYAENYSFQVQNEVQSMHWHSYQVTILVQITWVKNPTPNPHDESSKNIMTYHFYVSDDPVHDSYFVQHCLMLYWQHVVAGGFKPKTHFIWSDGCSNQFKSKVPWSFVARYPFLTDGCTCMWSFFGTGHGKGPHDGAGAVVKRYVQQAQLDVNGPQLQNAEQVCNLLRSKLSARPETSYAHAARPVSRTFWHIPKTTVVRSDTFMIDPIKGSKSFHSVRSVGSKDVNKLMTKSLACFCPFCIDCKWNLCENRPWTLDWKVEVLVPRNAAWVRDAMHLASASAEGSLFHIPESTSLACCLGIGDHLATEAQPGNTENVEFEILMYLCPVFHLDEHMVSEWGESFSAGDAVVKARYYQKWGTDPNNFIFLSNSREALVHVEHIKWVQFPMVPQDHRVQGNLPIYQLPQRAKARILQVLGLDD